MTTTRKDGIACAPMPGVLLITNNGGQYKVQQTNSYGRPCGESSRHNLAAKGYNPPQPRKSKTGGGYPSRQPAKFSKKRGGAK